MGAMKLDIIVIAIMQNPLNKKTSHTPLTLHHSASASCMITPLATSKYRYGLLTSFSSRPTPITHYLLPPRNTTMLLPSIQLPHLPILSSLLLLRIPDRLLNNRP